MATDDSINSADQAKRAPLSGEALMATLCATLHQLETARAVVATSALALRHVNIGPADTVADVLTRLVDDVLCEQIEIMETAMGVEHEEA